MKIDYGFTKKKGEGRVFLKNKNLVAYLPNDYSYYFGIFEFNGTNEPIKIIDSIINSDVDSVKVNETGAIFYKNKKKCEIIICENSIRVNSEFENYIDLDFRKLYDFSKEGRFYEIENGTITIVCCKQNNQTKYLAIKGKIIQENYWLEKHYPFDQLRGDKGNLWVYRLGKISGKTLIGMGNNKEEAIKNLEQHAEFSSFKNLDSLFNSRIKSLIGDTQIYAGLPWFFQYWSRDQLISLNMLPEEQRKKILLLYLNSLREDGRLPNRIPHSELGSADSIGIYALRVSQNIKLFSTKEKNKLLKLFNEAKKRLEKNYLKEELIINYSKETWMDTIPREGFNIEIQALYARLLSTINLLGGSVNVQKFVRIVRKKFVNVDNLTQKDIRPNIFLAYYFYPSLFTKKVWKEKFEIVIRECWLKWGGFSTIGKNDWKYHDTDLGITDESYHNGNSWFFVNNIAAIVMNDLGLKKYSKAIYNASMNEFLSQGLFGCGAEISDAKQKTSKGCQHQAWSLATLIELHKIIGS